MPYHIVHSKKGYFVENPKTHHKLSHKPLSKIMAEKQEVALYIHHRPHIDPHAFFK